MEQGENVIDRIAAAQREELRGFCKAWSAYLFPRNSLKYEGKAGEGAPVKLR